MSNMNDLRTALMATLASLTDKVNPMDIDRAKAVAQVAGVLVDTARVEVEFIKVTGNSRSDFIQPESNESLPSGVAGIIRHRIM